MLVPSSRRKQGRGVSRAVPSSVLLQFKSNRGPLSEGENSASWPRGHSGPAPRARRSCRRRAETAGLMSRLRFRQPCRGSRPFPGPAGEPGLLSAPGRIVRYPTPGVEGFPRGRQAACTTRDPACRGSGPSPGPAGAPDLLSAGGPSVVRRGRWSQLPDSNRRPPDYKSSALPTELSWPQAWRTIAAGRVAARTTRGRN